MRAEAPAEAVDEALAGIAQRNRNFEPITADELGDRGAAKGEVLSVDYVGRVDGAEFPGGTGSVSRWRSVAVASFRASASSSRG